MQINQNRYDNRCYEDSKKYRYRNRRTNRHFERDLSRLWE